VIPKPTPLIKLANTRDLGGEVVLHGNDYDEALAYAHQLALWNKCPTGRAVERGLTFIHAFDDDAIIAGQGTLGLELLDEEEAFDAVVAPIGGGGLISGIAIAMKETQPGMRIIGVEPNHCASMKAALAVGRPVEVAAQPTITDGLAVKRAGVGTFKRSNGWCATVPANWHASAST
jgi:threonine dehydratase